MHDVFISYEKETKTIADNIVNVFEKNSIRCWYAPRDVEGEYAQSIVNAIKKAKVFIIILNAKSSRSNHVLNEVETAYKEMDESGLIILPFKVSNEILSDAMTYYIKRFHWVDAANHDLNEAIIELLSKTQKILGIDTVKKEESKRQRDSNKYFAYSDVNELNRLKLQRQLLEKMTNQTYTRIYESYREPIILDVGSNDGFLTNEIAEKSNSKLTIGVEYDIDSVNSSNEKYKSDRLYFYQQDVEDEDFNNAMQEIMNEHKIMGFDIINISMVLLHLKNPFKVLKNLRRLMNKNGTIIIRDIDDGFTLAYPDPQGLFQHAIEIVNQTPRWGYRQSGRQIYTYLNRLGFRNIKLETIGLNTINMNFNERD